MRLSWILLGLLSAVAQVSGAAEAEWLACARVAEPAARLACFDAQAARVGGTPASVAPGTAPAAAAPPAPPAPAAALATFGAQPKPSAEVQAIESSIAGDFEGWGPRTLFQLTNGQRWMVSDDSSAVIYRKNPKVTIRRGAMGSFWFEVQGSNSAARVKRID